MREESQAPRNSRELAVRNQFFTPRYVVQFLTDNTLGRIWCEMRGGQSTLVDRCEYMVRRPNETLCAPYEERSARPPGPRPCVRQRPLLALRLRPADRQSTKRRTTTQTARRAKLTGETLAADYPSIEALRRALPALVLAHNLHGVDIDPRCAQIAQLALWMRAQRAFRDFGVERAMRPLIRRSNIVVAEPLVADDRTLEEFLAKLADPELARVFTTLVETLKLAGDLGPLLRVEDQIAHVPTGQDCGTICASGSAN